MKATFITMIFVLSGVVIAAVGCSRDEGSSEHQGHTDQAAMHSSHEQGEQSESPSQNASDPVLTAYLSIHEALAADSTDGVAAAATSLSQAASAHQSHGGGHGQVASGLIEAASDFQGADLEAAREAFEELSQQMIRYRAMMPGVLARTSVVHCSMADASWVQTGEQVENPYHGSSMLRCGEVTSQQGAR